MERILSSNELKDFLEKDLTINSSTGNKSYVYFFNCYKYIDIERTNRLVAGTEDEFYFTYVIRVIEKNNYLFSGEIDRLDRAIEIFRDKQEFYYLVERTRMNNLIGVDKDVLTSVINCLKKIGSNDLINHLTASYVPVEDIIKWEKDKRN